jgi:hypothetical protein
VTRTCEWCESKRNVQLFVLRWSNGAAQPVKLCAECRRIAVREGVRPVVTA